ncbi:phosphotransferase family protein [Pseudonocardia halophobica]|uniref:phosphotransferase family protein n=1 Tax=Pseudonocardia halophobica TaxID=29401 RepID=UPI003D93D668
MTGSAVSDQATALPLVWDVADLEPRVAELLDAKQRRVSRGRYDAKSADDVTALLEGLLQARGERDFSLHEVHRMAGGASKEQFAFKLRRGDDVERMVLRLDPPESIVETCRYREAEVFAAMARHGVPTPSTRFLDGDGTHLGAPGIVTSFVSGVTSPPVDSTLISGVGTSFTAEWRKLLAPQFIDTLTLIHGADWQSASLPHFTAPTAHPHQAALWQVNWWSRIWRDDQVDPYPLITLAERWMRERLPETPANSADLVLLHGDFRTGNFMFDPDTGRFSAVLDWELAHIGDFHEDLGWILQRLFAGPAEDGRVLACNLIEREELIQRYEEATGRTVNPRTLAFYEVLAAFKCAVMNLGTGYSAAARGHNHQDVLLSFLSPVGHVFLGEIATIIEREAAL